MNVVAIIPARFASTRLPGKPLARKTGKFLIKHVYEQVRAARRIQRCIVATDDERIAAAVRSFGGEACLTRADHISGTDRIAEVVRGLAGATDDIILNVQGDEPEIEPTHLDRLVKRLAAETACSVATLACPFPAGSDPRDPNAVKVVVNADGRALYFSRALIPFPRDSSITAEGGCATITAGGGCATPWLLHVGVYAYRRGFLLEFAGWEPSPLERIEKLEQLRVLERGHALAVVVVDRASIGVDTPEDYEQFVQRWQSRARAGA